MKLTSHTLKIWEDSLKEGQDRKLLLEKSFLASLQRRAPQRLFLLENASTEQYHKGQKVLQCIQGWQSNFLLGGGANRDGVKLEIKLTINSLHYFLYETIYKKEVRKRRKKLRSFNAHG